MKPRWSSPHEYCLKEPERLAFQQDLFHLSNPGPAIWHIIRARKDSVARRHEPAFATEEAVMLKPLLFVSAVVLFGITASSASGPVAQEAAPGHASGQKSSAKATDKSQARAKEIYTVDCAICHGETGDGKTDLAKDMGLTLKDWTDTKTLAAMSDEDLFKTIREGKDKMPAEAVGRAKDDEVRNLILYIRSLAKTQPAAAPPASN
jgi:mono/diheme cytochrome c family protein